MLCCVWIFLFKQKTAYEMRIRDWSSDVCSSDLAGLVPADLHAVAFGQGPGGFTGLRVACGVAQGMGLALQVPVVPVVSHLAVAEQVQAELGRASCRERVCQSV